MDYTVIIERSGTGFGAYVPDLPGCVATGKTLAVVKRRIREAVDRHIRGMLEDGEPVPRPQTITEKVHTDLLTA